MGTEADAAKHIGDTIRDARVARDLSKAEAARLAGVSRRTWHEIEEGQRPTPGATTLACFEQVLGIDEGTLYAMTPASVTNRVETLRRQAIEMVKRMSADDLDVFVSSQGVDTLRSTLNEMRATLNELRAATGEASGPGTRRARAGNGSR